jgi:RNA polymerase primary sigma factor
MEKALEKLVLDHLYLAKTMASRYRNKGVDYNDLVQEGYIGLLKAVRKFDKDRGVKFSTYATFWVKQAILETITNRSRTIRLPSNLVQLKLKIFNFTEEFFLSMGYEADENIIARELKVPVSQVSKILNLTTEHTGDWEPFEESTVEDSLVAEDELKHVINSIRQLSLNEQLILGMKFGILADI